MPATATIVKAALLALILSLVGALVVFNFTGFRLLGDEQGGHDHGTVVAGYRVEGSPEIHQGSPAYAPNGRDVSFLETSGAGIRDSVLTVCDNTRNGHGAGARAYNRETDSFTTAFDPGADRPCRSNVTMRNHEWHQTDGGAISYHN